MPEMQSLMGEIPEGLQDGGAATATDDDDNNGAGAGADDEELENQDGAGNGASEDDDDAGAGDGEGDSPTDEEDEDGDYITDADLEDEEEKPKPAAPAANGQTPQPPITDEGQYILSKLQKIETRVIVPGADGKDEVKTVQVYGWGDLPRDMKGFATTYEQGVFTASAQNQELEARRLQGEFRETKMRQDAEQYTLKENRAIARDLQALRNEGLFPKFKGVPGSKEFNESEGAKEFDKVIAFMNEQNDEAGQAAQKGDAFFHISFRQAFYMLHGTSVRDKAKQTQQGRQQVARRLKSGDGASKGQRNVGSKRVSNITDLADEFAEFAGSQS